MTEYYSRKEIISKLSVKFPKPEDKEYMYYDFDIREWVVAFPMDRLPFGLYTFKLMDGKYEDDDDKCIITCLDSYRLYETDSEYEMITPVEYEICAYSEFTHEQMLEEKKWRECLVDKFCNYEYVNIEKQIAYSAVCTGNNNDVISGVLLGGPVDCPYNGFYYLYMESRKLFKKGTLFK